MNVIYLNEVRHRLFRFFAEDFANSDKGVLR